MPASTQVYGVRETIKALKDIDPKAQARARQKIKRSAEPLRRAAMAAMPQSPPLSGWAAYSRRSAKAQIKYGGKANRAREVWPLMSLRLATKEGAMFDMAGRASDGQTTSGRIFIAALNARNGRASRALWPTAETWLPQIQGDVKRALEEVSAEVSRELVYRGGSR